MKIKTKLIAAAVLLVAAGLALPPIGDPDEGKKQVLLEAWSNQDRVTVFAQVKSTVRGVLYKRSNASVSSPWDLEFTVDASEVLEITVTSGAAAGYVPGGKVESKCRITVNGLQRKVDNDLLRMRDASIRSTQAQCVATV